ncbi:hypothetical protein HHL17_17315 [Chitinophaga sp. G-6-1-13]|uniref:Uncharacterized protein n=1 Tax=Chitinophaga fulva TaxID=2728842 RepID=A0A848GNL1_9BACT|nr:hypothetical protein [Chitinophaga fulva]NML38969.1 hypothetical protein [Chitinophaga fulva]
MYTSYIGKKFLAYYNRCEKKNFTAAAFFEDKFFKIFFKDEGHLMHVANSPFHYAPEKGAAASHGSKSKAQLVTLKERIQEHRVYMGTYVGGPAEDMDATTSGQLTGMSNNIDKEDMYASWIGAALGIGVKGGYVILIDDEEVLWLLYKGWEHYRSYLEQRDGLKNKQIETWNGNWLCHGPEFLKTRRRLPFEPEKVMGKWSIPTQPWAQITFELAKRFHHLDSLMMYAYNLSQTNTTLGFIALVPSEVNRLFEWREEIFFGEDTLLKASQIEKLETYYDFRAACKLGVIGLKALEPKALRMYMPKPFGGGKEFVYSKDTAFYFYTFKIWLIAMLNKDELLTLADEVAAALIEFGRSDKKGRTIKVQLSKEIRESRGLTQFVDKLTELLDDVPAVRDTLRKVVEKAIIMPSDHFPLFLSLIRFQFSYRSSEN